MTRSSSRKTPAILGIAHGPIGSYSGREVPLFEITVDLAISYLHVLCIWNSGDAPKNMFLGSLNSGHARL